MKKQSFLLLIAIAVFAAAAAAQTQPLLKRTVYKNDRFEFGAGGTLAVVGAPVGSIRVEGWRNREVEISAEIEVQAPTEDGLNRLAAVTGFVLQESTGRTGIVSVGTQDAKGIRKIDKKFPKELLTMPARINYVIKVPSYTDIEIDGGKGELAISGVEGTMRINYLEATGSIDLVGGGIIATFGTGSVRITVPSARWRGRFAEVQMAVGDLNIFLPRGLSSQFDAKVLRAGRIENSYPDFTPRVRNAEFTEREIIAKSGAGTIPLKFTVGQGNLKISELGKPN